MLCRALSDSATVTELSLSQRLSRMCCVFVQAEAFAVSGRQNQVQSYARAVAQAIQTGGETATTAYAAAFAQAYAGASDLTQRQGLHAAAVSNNVQLFFFVVPLLALIAA